MTSPSSFARRERSLPHAFPFEFVEPAGSEEVRVRISAASHYSRGGPLPAPLAVEILAQAASLDRPGQSVEETSGPMLLVGIEDASFAAPLVPGATLVARVEVAGAFGKMTKVRGQLTEPDGSLVAEAGLLLARS